MDKQKQILELADKITALEKKKETTNIIEAKLDLIAKINDLQEQLDQLRAGEADTTVTEKRLPPSSAAPTGKPRPPEPLPESLPPLQPGFSIEEKEEGPAQITRNIRRRAEKAIEEGNYSGAINMLRQARRDHDDPALLSLLNRANQALQSYKDQERQKLKAAQSEGNLDAAQSIAVRVLARAPGDDEFNTLLKDIQQKLGDRDAEKSVDALEQQARRLMRGEDIESYYEAVRLLEEALDRRPNDTGLQDLYKEARQSRNEIMRLTGRIPTMSAMGEYVAAWKDAQALLDRGIQTIDIGGAPHNLADYILDLQMAVSAFSAGKANDYLGRADRSFKDGFYERADSYINAALGFPELSAENKELLERKQADITAALEKRDQARGYIVQAKVQKDTGDYDQAFMSLRTAENLDPTLPELKPLLKQIHQERDLKTAREIESLAADIETRLAGGEIDKLKQAEALTEKALNLGRNAAGEIINAAMKRVRTLQIEIANTQKAISETKALMDAGDYDGAEQTLETLLPEGSEGLPWVKRMRLEISRHRSGHDNLQAARRAYRRGEYEAARDLLDGLRAGLPQAKTLWEEAQLQLDFRDGVSDYKEGRLNQAKRLFTDVQQNKNAPPNIARDAEEYLKKIQNKLKNDTRIDEDLKKARNLRFQGGLENLREAYDILQRLLPQPSGLYEDVRREWDELRKTIKTKLLNEAKNQRSKNLAQAWKYAAAMQEMLGETTDEIVEIGLAYYHYQAERERQEGDPDAALETLEKAARLSAHNKKTQLKMGEIYLELGKRYMAGEPKDDSLRQAAEMRDKAMAHIRQILNNKEKNYFPAQDLKREVDAFQKELNAARHLLKAKKMLDAPQGELEFERIEQELEKARRLAPNHDRLLRLKKLLSARKEEFERVDYLISDLRIAFDREDLAGIERYGVKLREEAKASELVELTDRRVVWPDPTLIDREVKGLKDLLAYARQKKDNLREWKKWEAAIQRQQEAAELLGKVDESLFESNLSAEELLEYEQEYQLELDGRIKKSKSYCAGIWQSVIEKQEQSIEAYKKLIQALQRGPKADFQALTKAAREIQNKAGERIETVREEQARIRTEIQKYKRRRTRFFTLKYEVENLIKSGAYRAARSKIEDAQEICPHDSDLEFWLRIAAQKIREGEGPKSGIFSKIFGNR